MARRENGGRTLRFRRESGFSKSGSRLSPAHGARFAANRGMGSAAVLLSCDIKDFVAVRPVWSEPVFAEFPVWQGKYREFRDLRPDIAFSCPSTC